MKVKTILINVVAASAIALAGCSTTDMNAMIGKGDAVSTSNHHLKATNPAQIKVYPTQKDLPKHARIMGRVTAQNYNLVGLSISQASILAELKKQAASLGANGITHISTGMAQTTADAVILK